MDGWMYIILLFHVFLRSYNGGRIFCFLSYVISRSLYSELYVFVLLHVM